MRLGVNQCSVKSLLASGKQSHDVTWMFKMTHLTQLPFIHGFSNEHIIWFFSVLFCSFRRTYRISFSVSYHIHLGKHVWLMAWSSCWWQAGLADAQQSTAPHGSAGDLHREVPPALLGAAVPAVSWQHRGKVFVAWKMWRLWWSFDISDWYFRLVITFRHLKTWSLPLESLTFECSFSVFLQWFSQLFVGKTGGFAVCPGAPSKSTPQWKPWMSRGRRAETLTPSEEKGPTLFYTKNDHVSNHSKKIERIQNHAQKQINKLR